MDYLERLAQPSAMQLARMGDFRAIAYWLNASLVPHGIYAQVAEDRPGTLLVLLEFFRLPRRNRLNDLVCHRLYRLHSPLIRGVRILARFANQSEILWDTSVRLVFAGQSRTATVPPRRRRRPRSRKSLKPAIAPVAALPAAAPTQNRRIRRRKTTTARHAAPYPAKVRHLAAGRSPRRRRSSRRATFPLTPNQLKLLGSSAAALFLLGFSIEMWKQADVGILLQDQQQGSTSIRTPRGRIPVIDAGADSTNPTVTLTFTGGSTLQAANHSTSSGAGSDAASATPTISDDAEAVEPFSMPLQERPLPRADVTLANLPQPIVADAETAEASSQQIHAAQNARVSLVNVSGQPASDEEVAAMQDTVEILQQSGLHAVGAGRNSREARQPEIVEVRGKRIAYLGYADDRSPQNETRSTNPTVQEQVAEDIQAIRGEVDWVIVNYHWTQDIASYPEPWQMELARSAIDQGADLVVGYHPDVLQGAEIYQGRAIAYSLGNFIFEDQAQSQRSDYDSAVLKVSLNDNRMRLEFLPVEVQGQQAAIATGERAQEIRTYLTQASTLFEKPLQSPMILDRLALDPNQPVQDESFDAEEPTPTVEPSNIDSFITYPDGDQPSEPANEAAPEEPFTSPSFTAPGDSTPPEKEEPKPASPEMDGNVNNGGWYEQRPSATPATEAEPSTSESDALDSIPKPQATPDRPDHPDATKDVDSTPDAFPSESAEPREQRWLPDAENLEESDTVPEEADKPLDAVL